LTFNSFDRIALSFTNAGALEGRSANTTMTLTGLCLNLYMENDPIII